MIRREADRCHARRAERKTRVDVKPPGAFIACLAIAAVALPATQASALAPPFTTTGAKAKSGPYKAEIQRVKIAVGSSKTLYWRVRENYDTNQQLRFDDASTPNPNPPGYKVRWFRGKQDITSAVKAPGGYTFVLKAGARKVFRARVKRRAAGSPFCLGGQFVDVALPYAEGAYFAVNDPEACA
jgi:hypothetical protein